MKFSTSKKNSYPVADARPSLLRKHDKIVLALFLAMFIASVIAYWVLMKYYDFTIYTGLPVMAAPFFVLGMASYIYNRRYIAMLFVAAISAVSYLILPESVLFIVYILVCTEGVAIMVSVIQRWMFYPILSSVERVNVKEKMDLKDKIIVFFFNIPVDLDTRNLKLDSGLSRAKLPWRDMFYTIMLALLFCMFLWIYMFLNPSISLGTKGIPIYTFTIILYLSALVLPWTVFSSLNVRISTDYRDFSLYKGFLGTFKRMFLPMFAAILFLLYALYTGPENLYYIGMSLAMIVVMIVFTSVMYYTNSEVDVVNDITSSWEKFHPSEIYSGYETKRRSSLDDGVPATPRRNPKDCFRP